MAPEVVIEKHDSMRIKLVVDKKTSIELGAIKVLEYLV